MKPDKVKRKKSKENSEKTISEGDDWHPSLKNTDILYGTIPSLIFSTKFNLCSN